MGLDHLEVFDFETGSRLHANLFNSLSREPVSGAIMIGERARRVVEGLGVHVFQVGGVVSAHPTEVGVVSDVRKGKAETGVAGKVPSFVAVHVAFVDLARSK